MTEPKHTPGPWYVSEVKRANIGTFIVKSKGSKPRKVIADVLPIKDQGLADARLIAAAPTLLEAAERVIRDADAGYLEGVDDLRAAIVQAKGGTP